MAITGYTRGLRGVGEEAKLVQQRTERIDPTFMPTPSHPSRAIAGLLLAAHRHEDFQFTQSGRVYVPSAEIPGKFYTVDPAARQQGTCTCPHWRWGSGYERLIDKHLCAAEFVARFREAVGPYVRLDVEKRHDSRLGMTTFDVVEYSEDYPAGRAMSAALSFEGALWDVIDAMQEQVAKLGEVA